MPHRIESSTHAYVKAFQAHEIAQQLTAAVAVLSLCGGIGDPKSFEQPLAEVHRHMKFARKAIARRDVLFIEIHAGSMPDSIAGKMECRYRDDARITEYINHNVQPAAHDLIAALKNVLDRIPGESLLHGKVETLAGQIGPRRDYVRLRPAAAVRQPYRMAAE